MLILYTGIGARKDGIHTKTQFLQIMKKKFTANDFYYNLYGKTHDPAKLKKYSFDKWIKWSGAVVISK